MSIRTTLPLVAALALAAGSAAAQKQSPGLWEITMQTKSGSGQMESAAAQMQQQLASLPPDQRKMVEEMMAKQGVGRAAGGSAIRVCVTKEQAERGDIPQDPKGNCKNEIGKRSASGMSFKFTCASPPSSGTGEIAFSGDKAYTMKMNIDTQIQGRPERMEMTHNGRWVAADCGSLARK